ncbi:hypothetical protein RRG08_014193 [Elysia crispata]|uniref:Uncharacterized protein n=1 Tax=Elysia crispata TaxID=231223 RepID=A0AAE0Z497_9GAST|nr:hypothetical protein RRG08_014193 [Elysia crispata]
MRFLPLHFILHTKASLSAAKTSVQRGDYRSLKRGIIWPNLAIGQWEKGFHTATAEGDKLSKEKIWRGKNRVQIQAPTSIDSVRAWSCTVWVDYGVPYFDFSDSQSSPWTLGSGPGVMPSSKLIALSHSAS